MKAIVIGAGKMGAMIESVLEQEGSSVLAMGDCLHPQAVEEKLPEADVLLDFSHRDNLNWYLPLALRYGVPAVIGTTGFTPEDLAEIEKASETIPVFFASNYSLGVALLRVLCAKASNVLRNSWDMEIIETHHHQKKDAPSGTALSLLDAIDPNHEFNHIFGRQGACGARGHEIGIHAVRGGTVPGDHTVCFFGDEEEIRLSHHAQSRRIFASGAVQAAHFLQGRAPGLYDMDSLLGILLGSAE